MNFQKEIIMATQLVQHSVINFAQWKKVVDSVFDLRASKGGHTDQVTRDAGDPNKLTVVQKWSSLASAQKWSPSPELKAAMEKAGVDAAPVVNCLNEA
jgi:heme-degrading monooxygenase HmoA